MNNISPSLWVICCSCKSLIFLSIWVAVSFGMQWANGTTFRHIRVNSPAKIIERKSFPWICFIHRTDIKSWSLQRIRSQGENQKAKVSYQLVHHSFFLLSIWMITLFWSPCLLDSGLENHDIICQWIYPQKISHSWVNTAHIEETNKPPVSVCIDIRNAPHLKKSFKTCLLSSNLAEIRDWPLL